MRTLHDRSFRGASLCIPLLVLCLGLASWSQGAQAEPSQGPSAEPQASSPPKSSETKKAETPKSGEVPSKVKAAEAKPEAKPAAAQAQKGSATPTKTASQKGRAEGSTPVASKKVTAASKDATASKPGKSSIAPNASAAKKTASAGQAAMARGQAKTHTMVSQEERVTYQYNALGRRDPFQPLIEGGFIGADLMGDALPDLGGLTVVGIVWGARDKFALAEDPAGNSLVLRRGDKVMNGFVERLQRDAIIVRLLNDGQSESVTIPLTRKGDDHGSN